MFTVPITVQRRGHKESFVSSIYPHSRNPLSIITTVPSHSKMDDALRHWHTCKTGDENFKGYFEFLSDKWNGGEKIIFAQDQLFILQYGTLPYCYCISVRETIMYYIWDSFPMTGKVIILITPLLFIPSN